MQKGVYYIIDFDSTFVTSETLEELARIVLQANPEKEAILDSMSGITKKGMEGKIPFSESLSRRIALFKPHRRHIDEFTSKLKHNVTPSIARNKQFFKKYADRVYIISGGFKEYIAPVVKTFGISETHVLANTFVFNKEGYATGYDKKNPLSKEKGKPNTIKKMGLKGKIIVIGDGYTDYEIKKQGYADIFYAFTENIVRDSILKIADLVLPNFDEFLYQMGLPRALSYPKNRMKILLLENIDKKAVDLYENDGYTVETLPKALSPDELSKKIADVSVLCIRSKTEVNKKVLQNAKKLLAVGAYCIGTNQVDLNAASINGIAVFNAPYSNTRSVVELILGEIIMLNRKVFDKSSKLHKGIWDKSYAGCHEVRRKTLGIIGYGNIGSQLSILAENMGMQVYFYDIVDKLAYGTAKRCRTMEEVLRAADVITIHVDGRQGNTNLIGDKEFAKMKDGVIFLNSSRGHIVNIESLTRAIKNGKVAGAAVDVFPDEPKSNGEKFRNILQNLPNVILTPHIGAGTEEAQQNIADFVTDRLMEYINTGATTLSVNFPHLQLPELKDLHRIIHIHKNVPGILAKINTILANNDINIEGQYLKTSDQIGYVITDVNKRYESNIVDLLKKIPDTIKVRVLY